MAEDQGQWRAPGTGQSHPASHLLAPRGVLTGALVTLPSPRPLSGAAEL